MGRHTDYVKMFVENPALTKLMGDMADANQFTVRTSDKLSREDATILAYLLLGYGIIEEVYLLYSKKWMTKKHGSNGPPSSRFFQSTRCSGGSMEIREGRLTRGFRIMSQN